MSDLNDSSTWALIASIAGAAATAVTAVNGLSRLSRLAKARRTIEWVNSTIDKGANDKSRNRTLVEMRTEQEAYIVATYYVPWWRLVPFPAWTISFETLFILAAIKGMPGTNAITTRVTLAPFTIYFAWLFIGSYRERSRISGQYKVGALVESRIPLWCMGNTLIRVASWYTAGINLLGGGLASLITGKPLLLAVFGPPAGFLMLFATIPHFKCYIQEWEVVTRWGSQLLGNEKFNFPRFIATTFVFRDPRIGGDEEW